MKRIGENRERIAMGRKENKGKEKKVRKEDGTEGDRRRGGRKVRLPRRRTQSWTYLSMCKKI